MRVLAGAEAFECRDLGELHGRHRSHAGPDGVSVDKHGAGTALCEPAAEFRAIQFEIVPQDIKQRCGVVDFDLVDGSVNVEFDGFSLQYDAGILSCSC